MNKGKFYPEFWVADSVENSMKLVFDYESTDYKQRWANETSFTIDLINKHANIDQQSRVLDYGSGVGRIAKPLIEQIGCEVDAYEPSEDLRKHSIDYVKSDKYQHVSTPNKYNLIICAWVALLIEDVGELYGMFGDMLLPDGRLLVIDYQHQLLTDDGTNYKRVHNGQVKKSLYDRFDVMYTGDVPDKYIDKHWTDTNTFSWDQTFWAIAQHKK